MLSKEKVIKRQQEAQPDMEFCFLYGSELDTSNFKILKKKKG
jgi:hypothetical protein